MFAEIGATVMNIHPDSHAPMHDRAFVVGQNLKSLAEILEAELAFDAVRVVE